MILADPTDPYYALAEEIAQRETLPIVHSLDQVITLNPTFLLWIVSPSYLSDQALIDFGLAMHDHQLVISTGIISGSTVEQARDLWLRASQVRGQHVVAVNAANVSGHIASQITTFAGAEATSQPLTKSNLARHLQSADYLTFTGHGGRRYWRLDEDTMLLSTDLPPLSSIVVGTASCNTFRIWEQDSIALAFVDHGAAAYAGFAYSPNEGYLIGEFEGVPFRYTWPDFPIGHVVQVQNHGTLQGFARFPYYYLLGDPRIALQAQAPYQLKEDREEGNVRILTYTDAPAGVIPLRIPGGAGYSFVKIPGLTAAWEHGPFYNSRLQMIDLGSDKYVLFVHQGGDFSITLRPNPPWYWRVADPLTDALDHTLLYASQTGGDVLALFAAGLALLGTVWFARRRTSPVWAMPMSVLLRIAFAALHGLYALVRLGHVTVTSKPVEFSCLALIGTGLLTGCGAFLFLRARSRLSKGSALLVATFPAWAAAVFGLGSVAVFNLFFFKPRLGVELYNYALGLPAAFVFILECLLFGLVFSALLRWVSRTVT